MLLENVIVCADAKRCVACHQCEQACAIAHDGERLADSSDVVLVEGMWTNRGVARQCDMCVTWRGENGKAVEACVEVCPTQAISFIHLDDSHLALRAVHMR